MNTFTKLSGLSVVLPAYNDALSLPIIIQKLLILLPNIAKQYEIIIVNDASQDNTQQVLEKLQKTTSPSILRIITHKKNLGYGATLSNGFARAKYEWIFYTDGDGQYDVLELENLVQAKKSDTDVVAGYKRQRCDLLHRKIIGALYNQCVKMLFGLKIKDTDCDFRLFKSSLIADKVFQVSSGGFDVELVKTFQDAKASIVQIPVNHFKRPYGNSQFFTLPRIYKSLRDIIRLKLTYGL